MINQDGNQGIETQFRANSASNLGVSKKNLMKFTVKGPSYGEDGEEMLVPFKKIVSSNGHAGQFYVIGDLGDATHSSAQALVSTEELLLILSEQKQENGLAITDFTDENVQEVRACLAADKKYASEPLIPEAETAECA